MEAAVDFAVKKLGYSSLKTEQLEIVMAVLRGRMYLEFYLRDTGRLYVLLASLLFSSKF